MKKNIFPLLICIVIVSCKNNSRTMFDEEPTTAIVEDTLSTKKDSLEPFTFFTEQFADLRILRYQVPGFNELSLQQKTLLYYLYEAALSGRDIIWDQNYKYNLTIRKSIEAIFENYKGDKNNEEWKKFEEYSKSVWFSNGIHHHYSTDKLIPEFSKEYFNSLISSTGSDKLPLNKGETPSQFFERISDYLFNPETAPKKVNLDPSKDLIKSSAVNFYEGVQMNEVSKFYEDINKGNDTNPIMPGLNSKLVKENGKLLEKKWMLGGMYSGAIEKIVYWLEKAVSVAENEAQKEALLKLIQFYKTGDLKDFDNYCIAWVKDIKSTVDVVNGFIETYHDPMGFRASYESVVSVKDMEASKRIAAIGEQAQWFEDNSPILPEHKKKNVKGIEAKVINVVVESGDAAPSTPIGINLPNNEWIRERHGSKSVNLGNIVEAYDMAAGASTIDEFYFNDEIKKRVKEFAPLADKLHTDMHEVIGHASGQLEPSVSQPSVTLKNYASTLEEARADLVALYYLYDKKLVELGVMPSLEYGKAAYDEYITKGLMVQLSRLKVGDNLEEAHMRNRQLVAAWVYEKGKDKNVIEKKIQNGKTYFIVNDYSALRKLFGDLLREIQQIKSKGDYKAGKKLVEDYGVKVDLALHQEVVERYSKLKIAPYAGFIQPILIPVMQGDKVIDVRIEYPKDFTEQMLYYGKKYSFLPLIN